MYDDKLQCPNCGAAMEDRGNGIHLCKHCYYEHDENPPEEKEPEPPKFSGPGFKEPWGSEAVGTVTHQRGGARTMAPPKDAPSPMRSLRGPGTVPVFEQTAAGKYPTLNTEKSWFYTIQVILVILSCIGALFAMIFGGLMGIFGLLIAIVWGACYLAILKYFLYETPSWGKWGCLIYQIVSIVGPILSFFAKSFIQIQNFNLNRMAHSFAGIGMHILGSILGIALSIWFITILWRDIQILKDESASTPEFLG